MLLIDFHSFPGGTSSKEPACQCRNHKRHRFKPWVKKSPWRRAWQPTLVFLPGESHGQRRLVGYCPQGHKESNTTEATQRIRTSFGYTDLVVTDVCFPPRMLSHLLMSDDRESRASISLFLRTSDSILFLGIEGHTFPGAKGERTICCQLWHSCLHLQLIESLSRLPIPSLLSTLKEKQKLTLGLLKQKLQPWVMQEVSHRVSTLPPGSPSVRER